MEPGGSLSCSKHATTFPVLGQIYSVISVPRYFFRINFHILPSVPKFSKWSLSLTFPYQNPVCIFVLQKVYHIPHQSRSPLYARPNTILWPISEAMLFKASVCGHSIAGFRIPLRAWMLNELTGSSPLRSRYTLVILTDSDMDIVLLCLLCS